MSKLPDFLGPYRLARFIRSGSTCQIWEAIRDKTDRFVLKVLRPDHWGNRQEIALLKHEFDVAHGLKHPSIIRIHDFNTEGKIAYLVLEVFSVLNVKQSIRDNPANVQFFFEKIANQSATALAFMHEHGWVHCDVKPDNFLLNDKGVVKLIDFSIAQRKSGFMAKMLGGSRTIRGTRSYMAPEQIRGKALDGRADVYSLGCVFYELLAGKPPYFGDSPNDLLQRHLTAGIPGVVVQNDNVTAEMSEFIRHMMAKKPENRPESMAEVIRHLRDIKPFRLAPKLPKQEQPEAAPEASED